MVGASAILEYGAVVDLIRKDSFKVAWELPMLFRGETPLTMAKSTGLGLIEMSTVLDNLKPDIVLVVGDRFEIMSAAIAAAYMNIPLAHTMGGEVSGPSMKAFVMRLVSWHIYTSVLTKMLVSVLSKWGKILILFIM